MSKMMEGANINSEPSEVQKFFKHAHIFITGGSGFLGQLLIQKLIRSCPDISKIYLLIRPKKGKSAAQRFEEMFENVVFERMKLEQPNYNKKIILLNGDNEQSDLGLSEDDRKLITDQVNVIFHVAATVRFNEKMKKAIAINVRATKDLIMLAKTMSNIQVFLHVSTAYSHCYRSEIGEQFYDVSITPERLTKMAETLTDDELDYLTPKLIGSSGWPNTYSFTKAIAENVIQEHGKDLPITIFRPAIVISTHNDPVKGWLNNYYGPVGAALAFSLGLLHSLHIEIDGTTELVPADYVINCMIVAASRAGNTFTKKSRKDHVSNIIFDELITSNETPIFNYTTSNENQITWGGFYSKCYEGKDWQSVHAIWHDFLFMTRHYYVHKLQHVFLQLIPAHIVDFFSVICGKKPRLVEAYIKMENYQNANRYFSTNVWKFGSDNTQELWNTMNGTDRRLFPCSMKELNWSDYLAGIGKGMRLYLLKDPMETLPKAIVKHKKLKVAHYCLVSVFSFICLTFVYFIFKLFL